MPGLNPTLVRDLLSLGMMYVADMSSPRDIRPMRALTFLYAFQGMGLIPDRQTRIRLMNDGASIQKILDTSYQWAGRKPKKRELERLGLTCEEKFILILPPRTEKLDVARVLGGGGYFLRITNAGLEHAETIEAAYAPKVNPESFGQSWEGTLQQLGAIHRRLKKRGGKSSDASVPTVGNSEFSIPPAVAQKEWMWDD
jgi:hypothetical protein